MHHRQIEIKDGDVDWKAIGAELPKPAAHRVLKLPATQLVLRSVAEPTIHGWTPSLAVKIGDDLCNRYPRVPPSGVSLRGTVFVRMLKFSRNSLAMHMAQSLHFRSA